MPISTPNKLAEIFFHNCIRGLSKSYYHWRRTGLNSMGASIKYNFGAGQKKGYTYVDNFGAGQENCGCKCTHCTHKFGAIENRTN